MTVVLSGGTAGETERLQVQDDNRRKTQEVQLLVGMAPPPLGAGPVCGEITANVLVQALVQADAAHCRYQRQGQHQEHLLGRRLKSAGSA